MDPLLAGMADRQMSAGIGKNKYSGPARNERVSLETDIESAELQELLDSLPDGKAQTASIALRVIKSLGIMNSERNIDAVNTLIENGMNTRNETVRELLANMTRYDAEAVTIVTLMKNSLKINQETISGYKEYKSGNADILREVETLVKELTDLVSTEHEKMTIQFDNMPASDTATEVCEKNLTEIIEENVEIPDIPNVSEGQNEEINTEPETETKPETEIKLEAETKLETETKLEVETKPETETKIETETKRENETKFEPETELEIETKSEFKSETVSETEALSKPAKEKPENDGISKNTDKLLLTPEELGELKSVKEYYKRLSDKLEQISKKIESLSKDSSSENIQKLKQLIGNINKDISFMEQVNRVFPYVQVPIRFEESTAKGELYVYADKKRLKERKGKLSVLLSLDMKHLGKTRVFIELNDKMLSTAFGTDNRDSAGIIESGFDELKAGFEKLGYIFSARMIDESEEADFPDNPVQLLERLGSHYSEGISFDVRT